MSTVALVVVFDRLGNCIANFIFAMPESITYVYRVRRVRNIYADEEDGSRLREILFAPLHPLYLSLFAVRFHDRSGIIASEHEMKRNATRTVEIINRAIINGRFISDTGSRAFREE